jgi:SAM-dependent methyltransferase
MAWRGPGRASQSSTRGDARDPGTAPGGTVPRAGAALAVSQNDDRVDPSRSYVLGHSEREIARLKTQARLIDPITRRFFGEAGLVSGMRVLDFGSGAGDVSFLAAEMLGARGEIVGVDRVPAALEVARARAKTRSLTNVTFLHGDIAAMEFDQPFDAAIGRYVLQFQRDPAMTLRQLSAHVRPGGLLAFHEIDWGGLASFPAMPTFDRCCRWGIETLRLHGTEFRMGSRLFATFIAAGLPPPSMRLEATIGAGSAIVPWLEMFADLIGTLLPEMQRLGVATAEEVGLDTLADRLSSEARALSSVIIGHHQIGAWARV